MIDRNRKPGAPGIALGLALAITLAACADRPATEEIGVTETSITVGTFGPQTGPAAAWGAVMRGMDAYVRLVNDEGGIHDREIRLIIKDDQYQPARTVASARELVERDQVFAVIGGIGTAPLSAARDYLTDHGVPMIGILTGAHQFTVPEDPLIFGGLALYVEEAAALVDHAVADGRQRVAIAYQNDDFGRGGLLGAEVALERHGLTLAASASIELMDTDVSAQALRLRQATADAVLLFMTPRHAAMLVQESARIGFRPQWLASTPLSDIALMHQLTGGLWQGTTFALQTDIFTDSDALRRMRDAHQRFASDERPGVFLFGGMQIADMFVEALRRAGPQPTRAGLIEALEAMEGYRSVGPPITYTDNARHAARSVRIARAGPDAQVEFVSDWVIGRVDLEEVVRRGGG